MKYYNIALTGTFDVENYGDLLFPVIFEKAMIERGLKFRLFLFSPSKTAPKALDKSTKVYSYAEFEKLHKKNHFDALVVGGGALIHYRSFDLRLPKSPELVLYKNTNSWLSPMLFAIKNNIKIIFNLPQVPFAIPEALEELTQETMAQVDYLSVRDYKSEKYLHSAFNVNIPIKVYPDSICSIDKYFSQDDLSLIRNKILPFDNYIVIHFAYSRPTGSDEAIKSIIKMAKDNNLNVVLLPLGYTHGDDVEMMEFQKKYQCDCFVPTKKLNINEMTAILAGCRYYIGTSFHGSIVSISFGHPAIACMSTLKNLEIYKMFNLDQYVFDNYEKGAIAFERLILNKQKYSPKQSLVNKKVSEHFDNIYSEITSPVKKKKDFEKVWNAVINLMSYESFQKPQQPEIKIDPRVEEYNNIINSRFWKATTPIRKILNLRKK